jgi:hypothetical protein
MFLVFSNHFDVLISKMIFKKLKNIIGMHFDTKSYLKSNHNHTAKQEACDGSYFPCKVHKVC